MKKSKFLILQRIRKHRGEVIKGRGGEMSFHFIERIKLQAPEIKSLSRFQQWKEYSGINIMKWVWCFYQELKFQIKLWMN